MWGNKHLEGNIYHMVHFNNLESIFQVRTLFSSEELHRRRIDHYSIANKYVQDLRDRIKIRCSTNLRFLHSYVPFYFARYTPMLRAQKDEVRNSIVFLEVSRSILKDRGVIFTDGNASNQQLSKYGSETAEIIPAATLHDVCRRYYHPDGPHGSNPNCSNFYANVAFLERLNWDAINSRSSRSDEKRRMKQAEVLIPDSLPLDRIQRILVSTPSMVQTVNKLIVAYRLKRYFSSAICETEMFL